MKKLLIVMTVFILSVNAAPNKDWYVGVGFFGGSGEQTQEGVSSTNVVDYDSGGADIKFGVIFDTDNRFEFSAITVNAKTASGSKATFKGRDFDWIFTANLNRQDGWFLPFVSAGFGLYKYDDTAALIGSSADISGFSGQIALGAYIGLSEVLEIELSYKNKAIIWEDYDSSSATNLSESMTNFYIGAKYKF